MVLLTPILTAFEVIGSSVWGVVTWIGSVFRFFLQALLAALSGRFYVKLFLRHLIEFGYYSLPVVGLTTLFSGMVMALQTHSGFSGVGAEATIPRVISVAIVRELAPVLAGLMLAGRVGAAITAELGTMRVTEQIDALHTLGVNPMRYLVIPRIFACTIALPVLVAIGDSVGILGGYLIAIYKIGLNEAFFIENILASLSLIGVVSGLCKAAAFGFTLSFIGCYFGFHSQGGAAGVGIATTNTVVTASILILILNFLITEVFFRIQ